MHLLWTPVISCLALLARSAVGKPVDTFSAKCAALSSNLAIDQYPGITVAIAEYLPAGSTIDHVAEGLNSTCTPFATEGKLPSSICRLRFKVPTSESSGVTMEAWFPENWSGRFMSTGNAGLGGCIPFNDLALATSLGFATVGTDNGHEGMSSGALLHQPEKLQDFVWRGLYTGAVAGKAATQQFYGKEHDKSYYFGCSSGGRMGWKAIQSFPDLFDGVVVGAPAIDFAGIGAWAGLRQFPLLNTSKKDSLSDNDWSQINKIVKDQCDHLDGSTDGILEDARQCKPDFEAWICKHGQRAEWCLTPAQVFAVHKMYAPLFVDGKIVHGGTHPGYDVRIPPSLAFMVIDFYRFLVEQDPNYKSTTPFTLDDARKALQHNPYNLQTFEGNISAFRDRGGKVIHWHGQTDDTLSITGSDRYYDHVSQTLGASSNELDDFYRYFRISGLNHCGGGLGAWNIGQGLHQAASKDPNDNVLTRIVEWVEKGNAPEVLRGTKFVNDDPRQGVAFSRKHCKHPKVNHYFGNGDGSDEDAWRCV